MRTKRTKGQLLLSTSNLLLQQLEMMIAKSPRGSQIRTDITKIMNMAIDLDKALESVLLSKEDESN